MRGIIDLVQDCLGDGQFSKALRHLEQSEEKASRRELYHSLRGDVFSKQFLFEKACIEYRKAIELSTQWAPPYNGLGNALVELGDYDRALVAFDTALTLAPNIGEFALNRGQLRLLLADWSGAKTDYEARLLSPTFQVHPDIGRQPAWLGGATAGKRILLYWEQGQGDTLQFIRYARRLEAEGAKLIIEAQDTLIRLLQFNFPNAWVISGRDQLPEFDFRAAIPSLPWLYGETPETVWGWEAYLAAPTRLDLSEFGQGNSLKIGMVWAGNPNHINDKQRSITLETLESVFTGSGGQCFSLQVGASDKERRFLKRHGIIDIAGTFTDFADTAAAIQALDLVITVDTSVAHLAGALGKTVWILLPFVPDWRWMLNRSDSPWYPSARLFRQPKRGDWGSVLKEVKQALVAFRDQAEANSAA